MSINARSEATIQTLDREGRPSNAVGRIRSAEALPGAADALMRAVVRALQCLLSASDFDAAIQKAMRIVGEAAEIHRFKVILSGHGEAPDGAYHELAYEWYAPFLQSQASCGLTRLPDALIGHLIQAAQRGQSQWQFIDDVQWPLRGLFEQAGMQSMGVVPIFAESSYAGIAAFDDCRRRREWNPGEIDALTTAAQSIGAAICRHNLERNRARMATKHAASLRKINASLHRGLAAISQADNFSEGAGRLFREICEISESPVGHLFRYDPANNTLRTEWRYEQGCLTRDVDPSSPPLLHGRFDADITPWFRHTIQQRDILVADLRHMSVEAEAMSWPGVADWHRANGRSFACAVPLFVGDLPVGVIGLAWETLTTFTAEMTQLLQTLSTQAALVLRLGALSNTLSELAAKHLERQLMELKASEAERASGALQATVDALQDVTQVEEIVPRVLNIVARTFGSAVCAAFENDVEGLIQLKYWHAGGKTMTPSQLRASGQLDTEAAGVIKALAEGFTVPDSYLGTAARFAVGAFLLDHQRGTSMMEFDRFAVKNGWDLELNIGVGAQGLRHATLCIYRPAQYPFTAAEQALGESLAKQMALAIGMARHAVEARQVALAMERQQAVRERVAELSRVNEALRRSLSSLAESADVGSALQEALRTVVEVCGASGGAIGRYLPLERGFRNAFQFVGQEILQTPGLSYEERLYSLDEPAITLAWEAFQHSDAVLWCEIASPYLTEDTRTYMRKTGLSGVILAPLRRGSECIGYLALYSAQAAPLLPGQQELVRSLSDQIALMLELTRLADSDKEAAVLREQESAAQARAEQLAKANRALKQTLDVACSEPNLQKVLGHILRAITQQLKAPSSALWLLDHASKRFQLHLVWHDQQVVDVNAKEIKRLNEISGWDRDLVFKDHLQERRPILYDVTASRETNSEAYEYFTRLGIGTLLGIPLLMGDDVVGSLTVRFDIRRELAQEDLALTQGMAHQATMAIQLTRLGEQASAAAVTEERARLARDVHDTLAQGFTGILMQLGAASQVLGSDRAAISPQLNAISSLARSSLLEARRSVRALRQLPVEEGPLERRIERFVERMRLRTRAAIDVQIEGPPVEAPARVQSELLGIIQESINNAVRHASAKRIRVCMEYSPPLSIRLSVKDDGDGFDSTRPVSDHSFGLVGMQERASAVGASLTVISEVGRGTEVVVQYGMPGGKT